MDLLEFLDTQLRLVGAIKNFVLLGWFIFWFVRFFRNWRSGQNNMTAALAFLFFALSDERLWSVSMGIYTASSHQTELMTVLMLIWREISLWLTVFGLILLTWTFKNFNGKNQNDH